MIPTITAPRLAIITNELHKYLPAVTLIFWMNRLGHRLTLLQGTQAGLMITLAVIGVASASMIGAATAQAYPSRGASKAERSAIGRDAQRTEVCGFTGRQGRLEGFKIVNYKTHGRFFKWAQVVWSTPNEDPCDLEFLYTGQTLESTQTPLHAAVTWYPFTWGSSPFGDIATSYLNTQWRSLQLRAPPPKWSALIASL